MCRRYNGHGECVVSRSVARVTNALFGAGVVVRGWTPAPRMRTRAGGVAATTCMGTRWHQEVCTGRCAWVGGCHGGAGRSCQRRGGTVARVLAGAFTIDTRSMCVDTSMSAHVAQHTETPAAAFDRTYES